ncbi:hypothetical protein FVA74_01200 [Salinibacterium sp. dk2585]|uniref:hypothetical protein n=1 Tax=unclassified Salinibacterium TaxID=2632331 RepID=UPI0011C24FFB|nr:MULTISPECIES: hypothetical protein [unclassified Salinibacterium]QEE60334.1 hypothetical protein FVA74_01200 [Salinibacterium sp. dk2585]TXK55406.1 hypothetical protein FVP63_01345 [Salinibacterium sp. dk5596]
MSAALEQRYRRALRWYPAQWRARHEEVVLSTLLDGADAEGRATPGRGELLNLAVTGLAARASGLLPLAVRDMIATVSLATGTVLAITFLFVYSWAPWVTEPIAGGSAFGPFRDPGVLVYGLWPFAYVLFLLRRRVAMRWMLGVAAIAAPLLRAANWVQGDVWSGPMTTTLGVLMMLAVGALLGVPERRAKMAMALGYATAICVVIVQTTGSIRHVEVWERAFWLLHSSPIEWIVLGTLAAAVVLGIIRRPHAAVFAVVLAAPWMLAVGFAALRTDFSATAGLALYAAVLAAAASVVVLAVRRSQAALRRSPQSSGSSARSRTE